MRRGLMAWNESELPREALSARLEGLRSAMVREGIDGFVCYTNLVQPSAVTYLTGFTPYWSDALLLTLRSGAPVFATALSRRVANWIASTNPLSEIVNTPKPGAAIGARLATVGARRVAVLELDRLPGGLNDEIAAAAPDVTLVDGSAIFATLRRHIDDAECDLIVRADAIARDALGQIDPARAADGGVAAGLVEKRARLQGAEEAYIAVAANLVADRRMVRVSGALPLADWFAVRASVAYKGSWVRRTRTFAKDAAASLARADEWFETFIGSVAAGEPIGGQLTARVAALPGATLTGWIAESAIGSYPLETVASARAADRYAIPAGGFAVLTVELSIGGTPWLGAGPVIVGEA
jgi:hypothetical protein